MAMFVHLSQSFCMSIRTKLEAVEALQKKLRSLPTICIIKKENTKMD